jgi:hypothetical protein
MPPRARLVLVAVLLTAFGTPRFSNADPTVINICVNPGGAIRAIDPSEACPRSHTRVQVPLGSTRISFYTVARPADTIGPLTGSSISVSCEEGDDILSGGYVHGGFPDLEVSGSYPDGTRTWIVEIRNFSVTLSRQVALFARCARLSP